MKRLSKILFTLLVIALLAATAVAQDSGPGEGGTIVEANIGDDPPTFNPIISNDTTSGLIGDLVYPAIISLNPETLEEEPMVAGSLAESWEYDETGTVLTLHLREGLQWSDGEPITARDYMYVANAVRSGQTSSPRTYVFYKLDDGSKAGGFIHEIEMVDDYTLRFTLGDAVEDEEGNLVEVTPNCVAFSDINDIAVVPSHLFEAAYGTDYALMDEDPYLNALGDGLAVSGLAWADPFFESGVQVSLVANQSYADSILGYVSPGEWIYLNVENQTVEYERFLAGEFTFTGVSAQFQNELRGDDRFQITEYPANGYTYVSWNVADPANPQNGLDENGNVVDQGIHPFFGDKLVRQAMAYAIDTQSIIGTRPNAETGEEATGILEGNGTPVAVHNHPMSWVDPELDPYPFDQEKALELLAEAGWTDGDGDGILECNGCLYATEVDPEFEGTPFAFDLLTNAGNEIRERTGTTIKAQLEEIGITVNYQAIEWGTLLEVFLGQSYDAIIIGWSLGLPFDPDGRWAFGKAADRVGSGFNPGSYYNQELEDIWQQATTVPGCDRAARLDLYKDAMNILYDEQPYLWLFYGNVMVAAQSNVGSFDPFPYQIRWNMDAWSVED